MIPCFRDLFGKVFLSYHSIIENFLHRLLISCLFFSVTFEVSSEEVNSLDGETKSTIESHDQIFAAPQNVNQENVKGYAIKKVNHEFVDLQGNATDVIADSVAKARYQKDLEGQHVTGMRFHIHWTAPSTLKEDLTVKLDIQGYDAGALQSNVQSFSKVYTKVEGFSGWAVLDITESTFKRMGKMMAWKVTLLHDGHAMAARKSFTWDDR